ncbi:hypothetical protein OEB96_08265 [Paraliomyxa miuraensis]|nr:hypothetical protein [Paraliomyxa miuraensis]
MRSVPPNPGGSLPPDQILGRDSLIDGYWSRLEHQSLALFSPRRVGKTSILRRMEHRAPVGWHVRHRDLEGLDSAHSFAQRLYEDASALLPGGARALARARALLERLTGSVELKNVTVTLADQNWRRLIESLFEDLDEEMGKRGERLVFLWDEFTLFIGDLTLRGSERDAMVLLDTLRAARQQHLNVRMVLTGSIGFHLVMRQLDAKGYRNRPINDVRVERVPMFEAEDARPVVAALLRGIDVEPEAEVVETIIRQSEGHPFVIQHLVESLQATRKPTADDVASSLTRLLAPPSVLDLGHYATRLSKYYAEREAPALAVLDLLAREPEGVDVDDLFVQVPHERELLRTTIQDLRDDDYVVRRGRSLRFSLDFVRRHWCEDRML